jgi:hypothetical protein
MSDDLTGIAQGHVTQRKAEGHSRIVTRRKQGILSVLASSCGRIIRARRGLVQVLPAQDLWRREVRIRWRMKPGNQETAEQRYVIGGEWSDFAGHNLPCSTALPAEPLRGDG